MIINIKTRQRNKNDYIPHVYEQIGMSKQSVQKEKSGYTYLFTPIDPPVTIKCPKWVMDRWLDEAKPNKETRAAIAEGRRHK